MPSPNLAMCSLLMVVILTAVSSRVTCQQLNAQCVDHLRTLEDPVFWVDPGEVLHHYYTERKCFHRGGVLAHWRALLTVKGYCVGQWVPVNTENTDGCLPFKYPDKVKHSGHVVPVFDVTAGECRFVSESQTFSCILCQYEVIRYPFNREYQWLEDFTRSQHFMVHFTSTDVIRTTKVDEEPLKAELETILQPDDIGEVALYQTELDKISRHLEVDFEVHTPLLASAAKSNASISVLNNTFLMNVEDVGYCASEKTVDEDGSVTRWPRLQTYAYHLTKSPNGNIMQRICLFDYYNFHGEWGNVTRWELAWRPCESQVDKYVTEEHYKQFLDAADIDIRHADVLHNYTSTPGNSTTLKDITRLVGTEMAAKNILNEDIIRDLVTVTANLKIDSNETVVAMDERAYIIVSDIDASEPVIGFACNCNLTEYDANETIMVEKAPAPLKRNFSTPFALDISPRLMVDTKRVAFVALWKQMPMEIVVSRLDQYLEVNVFFPLSKVSSWTLGYYGNYYVDITYFPQQYYGLKTMIEDETVLVCVAWNNNLNDWVSQGCEMLYVDRNGFSACRCNGKYFALHDGVPTAKYALKKASAGRKLDSYNNPMTDFFKDKIILKVITAIECLLSLIGLGSIICTAILFKHWREDKGHKILLHMVLALTCNLVLGFTASYLRMTTSSVGCLVYGVLRHYSFLSMFLWMLVLSCLQLKRLTTVVGAKATPHLILKVSAFAWGVPLLPITILLAWNPGFYQADRFDRGYCYPERIIFHATVQGPAGFILLVNLGIFIKIVLHIFEFIGEKKITRHSKEKRAEQLRKLKTSLFIFFLFGFSWVFHILSEERVIVSDFLFEYLFLMTATTHIFALSLFFVVLQENTRKDWIEVLKLCRKNLFDLVTKK